MMLSFVWILVLSHLAAAKVQHKVKCSDDVMLVELRRTDDMNAIYLEGLKHYPEPACKAMLVGHQAIFKLSLSDVYQCGVTRIVSQATGLKTYYHRIVVEKGPDDAKEILSVKCLKSGNHTILKRNVLPAGFQEPSDLEITTSLTKEAPQPKLQVGVRQAGQLVSGELNVNPGTPLQMEIYLDKASAHIYGLLVSYMQVSDTKAQEETIIFNGCSVDPYLFENFNTVDGDFLTAKFRAFKFPDSTYVQFKGTVNICLDKCRGVDCNNGQIGYGRRKREIPEMPPDPNKVFEVSITSFIKVDYKGDNILDKVKLDLGPEPIESVLEANETLAVQEISNDQKQQLKMTEQEVHQDLIYNIIEERNHSFKTAGSIITIIGSLLYILLH